MTDSPSLRVAVTGASGLVGSALASRLEEEGHRVLPLVRRTPRPDSDEVRWDPADGGLDLSALTGTDAVVHLAGENLSAQRWTPAFKERLLRSRVEGTRNLCSALARLERPPGTLVCASAVGYYGDRGDESVTEESPPGAGFLADVCRAWETACEPARRAGLRVVNLRIGVVLSSRGGALPRMLTPFRLGLGGPVGSGRQWMSWVSLPDLVSIVHRAVVDPDLGGAVNAVAPGPVPQAEFARILGRVLRRPARLPLPGWAVRLALGEMGRSLLLEGARVRPARLETMGFSFRHPELEEALRTELGLREA